MPTPRRLKPEDAQAYCALRHAMLVETPWAFFSAPGDDVASNPRQVARRLQENENAILAIADEHDAARLLTVAGVRRIPRAKARHRAEIWGVYCDPSARGRGYARAVVAAAIETARAWRGVEIIALSVSEGSAEAVQLYESLGFVRWGVEPDLLRVGGRSYDEIHLVFRL